MGARAPVAGPLTADDFIASARAADREIEPELLRRLQSVGPPHSTRRLMDGATFAFETPERPPAIIGSGTEVLWSSGEYALLTGPEGVGKTTLDGHIVLARAGIIPNVL